MSNKWEATFHPEGQITPTPAQESTLTAEQGSRALPGRRADAAESALRQVREAVEAWADEAPSGTAGLDLLRQIVSTRVGAADTQPEGAGDDMSEVACGHREPDPNCAACRHWMVEPSHCDECHVFHSPSDHPLPTAGSNGDTAPEACYRCAGPATPGYETHDGEPVCRKCLRELKEARRG